MRAKPVADQDPAFGLTPPITLRMPWRIAAVEPLPAFRFRVRFIDGTEGEADMAALVHSETAGVFATLADPALFAQVSVVNGAVTWPGEIDLAPDALYAALRDGGGRVQL